MKMRDGKEGDVSKKIVAAVSKAKLQAMKSEYLYRIGSIAMRKGKVIGYGFNKSKVHANLFRNYGFYSTHSEVDCLTGTTGADTLVVVRISKKLDLTCSKPCTKCMRFIRDYGVKRVIYSDWNGDLIEIDVSKSHDLH